MLLCFVFMKVLFVISFTFYLFIFCGSFRLSSKKICIAQITVPILM